MGQEEEEEEEGQEWGRRRLLGHLERESKLSLERKSRGHWHRIIGPWSGWNWGTPGHTEQHEKGQVYDCFSCSGLCYGLLRTMSWPLARPTSSTWARKMARMSPISPQPSYLVAAMAASTHNSQPPRPLQCYNILTVYQ